jgi:ankyrin repeat protein
MEREDFTFLDILLELNHKDICELYDSNLHIHKPDVLGNYLLNIACQLLQVQNVRFFISKGANLETTNHLCRDTPILITIDHVHHNPEAALKIVEMLLHKGANIEHRGYMDKTPFLKACTRNNLEMIKLLVAHGCNVRASTEDPPGYINNGLFFADVMHVGKEVKEYLNKLLS